MKVFVIGETGLLGYNATLELLKDGHEVSGIGVTPPPTGGIFKSLVKYEQLNVKDASDKELENKMEGNDWLLCAFSASAKAICKKPAIDYYTNFNIYTIERILRIAKNAKIKKVVLLSNYLENFNLEWAYLGLSKTNPYIKSLYEQTMTAKGHSLNSFKVITLQLPMVFGIMPKRKPYDYEGILNKYKNNDFSYFNGGTAVMTVKQVGQAVLGAFKYGQGGKSYPLAGDNMSYKEINKLLMDSMGCQNAKFQPVNKFLYKMKHRKVLRDLNKQNLEPGINPIKILPFYEKEAFIDPNIAMRELRVAPDNVRKEIVNTAKRVLEIAKENKDI